MQILKYKNVFLSVAAIMVLASLFTILTYGFKRSIDFTGGAKVVFNVNNGTINNDNNIYQEALAKNLLADFGEVKLSKLNESATSSTFTLVTRPLNEADYTKLQTALKVATGTVVEIKEFAMTGPSISSEIVKKSILGFILVSLAIILFIWFSFRGASQVVASWKYGLVAIAALVHDVIIPAGVMSYLGGTMGVEIDALFVVALLTILGISVSDTIVIFDRIRENLKGGKNVNFEEVVGKSLDQSMVRSLATSVSVILVLLALVLYGPASTKYFALTLTIGMFVGIYSSIFVASPLLVWISKNWKSK
jgi:preprotein translocase subunit SecF